MARANKSARPHEHSTAVLRGVAENLLRDAELLTDRSMAALAESRRAAGIPYIPEECTAIRDAVRDWYVRGLADRLITGLTEDVGND
jgi:hypothetical protein